MDWRKKHEQTGFAWRKIPFGTGGRDDSAIYWVKRDGKGR